MERIENDKGFIVYEADLRDLIKIGGYGICDYCGNAAPDEGYLIAVLNSYYCSKCYKEWLDRASYYVEDAEFEMRVARYWKKMMGGVN